MCETLLPAGRKVANEWVCGDVTGKDGDSLHVQLEGDKQGQWFDFAASIGGDLLKLAELNLGLKGSIAAADWARSFLGLPAWAPNLRGVTPEVKAFNPLERKWHVKSIDAWVHPKKAWAYRNDKGEIIAYVCRVEWEENGKKKKDVLPMRQDENGEWKWKGWTKDDVHPIYGAELLAPLNDGRPLLIVEGEKTCDAARKLFPKFCAITWQGGTNAVSMADWKPWNAWKGPVVLWPDNDDEGHTAMLYLKTIFPKSKKVTLPPEVPSKWDLADNCPDGVSVRGLLHRTLDEKPSREEMPLRTGTIGDAQSQNLSSLEEAYGHPIFRSFGGAANGLNERFFAGLVARENEVLFDPDEGHYYLYAPDTGLWIPKTADAIRDLVARRILRFLRGVDECGLIRKIQNRITTSIVSELRAIVERRQAFQRSSPQIHVANGMLLPIPEGGFRLLPFSSQFMSRNQSPLRFDPDATCPRFLDALLGPVLNSDDAAVLQKFAGLALMGRNTPQRILLLHGEANTGKGTIVRVICHLIGMPNIRELRTEHLNERFEINRLAGGTLLLGQDVPANFLELPGASLLKKIVGGDYLDGEPKGRNGQVRIQGVFNMLITSNSRLRVRLEGDHSAWFRRLTLVEFRTQQPIRRIPDFEEVLLREEGSGILNWAIRGAELALADIELHGDIQLTNEQIGRVKRLLSESDSVRQFVAECVVKQDGGTVTSQEASAEYFRFCQTHDYSSLSPRQFENALPSSLAERFGVTKSNDITRFGKAQRGWRGIAIPALNDRPGEVE